MDEQSIVAEDDSLYRVNPGSVLVEWEKYGSELTQQLMLARGGFEELKAKILSLKEKIEWLGQQLEDSQQKLRDQEAFAVDQQMLLDRYKALHGDLPPEPEEETLSEPADKDEMEKMAEATIRDLAAGPKVAHLDTRELTPRRGQAARVKNKTE